MLEEFQVKVRSPLCQKVGEKLRKKNKLIKMIMQFEIKWPLSTCLRDP